MKLSGFVALNIMSFPNPMHSPVTQSDLASEAPMQHFV